MRKNRRIIVIGYEDAAQYGSIFNVERTFISKLPIRDTVWDMAEGVQFI